MLFFDEERLSDSPFVERVWRSHSEGVTPFLSIANSQQEMVVGKLRGKITFTIRGPETRATPLGDCPGDGEWFGVILKHGTYLPHFPAWMLKETGVDLPGVARDAFWFHDAPWQFPTFDNAETFVAQLARRGMLAFDPLVGDVIRGPVTGRSPRTIQRHFLQTTGLTLGETLQIERARYATYLLQHGVAIPDVIQQAGYFDQPHLTRALKRFIGRTPRQIVARSQPEQMSFLYKTAAFD